MPVSMTVLTPQISEHYSKTTPQPPLFSGHVKVSNLTPKTRSQRWMGSGEGRGGGVGLGHKNVKRGLFHLFKFQQKRVNSKWESLSVVFSGIQTG